MAYTGARIVTMKGDEVLESRHDRRHRRPDRAVGPPSGVVDSRGGQESSTSPGRPIIPGLFDEHAHLHYSTLDIFPQRPWKYLANLAYGVTTTHDPSASNQRGLRPVARWSRPG